MPLSPLLLPWAGRGSPAAARRMARGIWLNDGDLIETAPGAAPWDYGRVPADWVAYLHGQAWLEDFAALRGDADWSSGPRWTHEWIAAFGWGRGPGWGLDVTARRQIRWLCHREMLLDGASKRQAALFLKALARQSRVLAWQWRWAPAGLPRLEALSGHILSQVLGKQRYKTRRLLTHFGAEAALVIEAEERLLGRNPAQLMRLVDLLSAMAVSMEWLGYTLDERHEEVLAYYGPMLAALCEGDARLPRFHGAPAGRRGDASRVLARFETPEPLPWSALDYGRLYADETKLVMDGGASARFASALAIEFNAGAQPILVNSGSGRGFGSEEESAATATRSHTSLMFAGESHPVDPTGDQSSVTLKEDTAANWLIGRSEVWRARRGVVHHRRLRLARDGRSLQGEDVLRTEGKADRKRLEKLVKTGDPEFELRFLLHPEVRPIRRKDPRVIRLKLPDGTNWQLRIRGAALRVEPALYYDSSRLHRRATKTIVASSRFVEYLGRITWSLEAVSPS
ncbi:MAG: heparinase II/III family protein [Pseudomonadota bacterium]